MLGGRKIFRGKTIDEPSYWIIGSGSFVDVDNKSFIIFRMIGLDENGDSKPRIRWEEVTPTSVQQFINRYDNHSRKIFEGDIIRYKKRFNDDWEEHYLVVMDRDCVIEEGLGLWYPNGALGEIEIVGNIIDDYDLLDGKCKHYVDRL